MLINKNKFKDKRGSAITAVVIFTLLVVIVVSSIIGLSLHEKTTLEKNQILNEAKYAAESMGEFVAAQIVAEYSRVNGEGVLTPDITVPDRVISFFKPDFMRVRDKTFSSGNVEERLGVYVSPKYDIVLDSSNPFYENDLDAKEGGAEVNAYDVVIYTYITNENNNEETDFYLEQLFQVREKPLTLPSINSLTLMYSTLPSPVRSRLFTLFPFSFKSRSKSLASFAFSKSSPTAFKLRPSLAWET